MVFVIKKRPSTRLSKLMALAFDVIIARILFEEDLLVKYRLIGIGVILALIDIVRIAAGGLPRQSFPGTAPNLPFRSLSVKDTALSPAISRFYLSKSTWHLQDWWREDGELRYHPGSRPGGVPALLSRRSG